MNGFPLLRFSLQKNTPHLTAGYFYSAYFELTHLHHSDLEIFLITTLGANKH